RGGGPPVAAAVRIRRGRQAACVYYVDSLDGSWNEKVGYASSMSIPQVKRRARGRAVAPRTVVAVIGSGQSSDPHAAEVGRLIAPLGHALLRGAGGGVMEAASRAFFETTPRRGIVIGVVPGFIAGLDDVEDRIATAVRYDLPHGYPNDWVELPIY